MLTVSVLFSSCFEVVEEIALHSNGSGTMTLTVNLSQSKTRVAQLLLLDHIDGFKVPGRENIQSGFLEAIASLKQQAGITVMESHLDMEHFIATVKFSFRRIETVNAAVKSLWRAEHIQVPEIWAYRYQADKKLFIRDYHYLPDAKSSFEKLSTDHKKALSGALFTSITRFDDPVESISNPSARLSADKKAVMQQSPVPDLINGSIKISNQIQLKN